MYILKFKNWWENQTLGGGLEPPQQAPIDPTPAVGQTCALPDYHLPWSKELPPTKKNKMKKK